MGLHWLLLLAVLASVTLLEFSVGKVRYLEFNSFPEGAIWGHISSNVTFIIFQIHSQYQKTTISLSETILPNASRMAMTKDLFPFLDSGLITLI
ncbi:hypothetical protein G4228_018786 [Cervus hanglu yarkandensis]|nr:hypothetical protein G4228_018786 [Cervus hanglu yarkandensis]